MPIEGKGAWGHWGRCHSLAAAGLCRGDPFVGGARGSGCGGGFSISSGGRHSRFLFGICLFCLGVMHAMEGAFKVFLQSFEGTIECFAPGDKNIVVPIPCEELGHSGDGGLEAPSYAVAFDSSADRLRDRETEAGRT
jgi:hypothetical protein